VAGAGALGCSDPATADARDAGASEGEDLGSGADTGPTDGRVDAGDGPAIASYCAERARRYFDYLQRCYGEQAYPESQRAELVGRVEGRCRFAERAVREGRLAYDPAAAQRCLARIATESCVLEATPPACEGIFTGLVRGGGACYPEESRVFAVGVSACAAGRCEVADDRCPGTCVAAPAVGESCANVDCGRDGFCDGEAICQPRRGQLEPCRGRNQCSPGLVCGPGARCVPLVEREDEACGPERACPGVTICVDARCVARVAVGEPCVLNLHCPDDALCVTAPESGQRVCVERPVEGEACDDDLRCASGLTCQGGTCAELPVEGEACVSGRCASGLFCERQEGGDARCRALRTRGESCASGGGQSSEACAEGLFCTRALTCQPPGGPGEACNVFQVGSCEDGLWCERATGTCRAPAAEGAPCNPAWETACADGLGCACGQANRDDCRHPVREPVATDTCAPLAPVGDACFRSAECATGFCSFDPGAPASTPGVCVDPDGRACLPP
jgi:hypothetical protein